MSTSCGQDTALDSFRKFLTNNLTRVATFTPAIIVVFFGYLAYSRKI